MVSTLTTDMLKAQGVRLFCLSTKRAAFTTLRREAFVTWMQPLRYVPVSLRVSEWKLNEYKNDP